MMEPIMKRYILEQVKDASLIKKFDLGIWYPNIDEFRFFYTKQEKNNECYSNLINKYNLIKKDDIILESVISVEMNGISDYLNKKSKKLMSGYGTIYLPLEEEYKITTENFYISNGIYHNTESLCYQMYEKNKSFIVGVCADKNSIYFKENLERLKELKYRLKKKRILYREVEQNNHRNKSIILVHKGDL